MEIRQRQKITRKAPLKKKEEDQIQKEMKKILNDQLKNSSLRGLISLDKTTLQIKQRRSPRESS